MINQHYMISSKNGIEHAAVYSNPNDDAVNAVVIVVAGSNSGKDFAHTAGEAERRLNKNGIATIRIDAYGLGESTGKAEEATLTKDIQGILDIIEFARNELGHERVALLGTSYGGATTLMAATKAKPEIECLCLRAPVSNWDNLEQERLGDEGIKKWKEEDAWHWPGKVRDDLYMPYSFMEDARQHDGWAAAKDVKCPVLILHGNKDEDVPIEQSVKLHAELPDSELIELDGVGHGFAEGDAYEKSSQMYEDFFVKHLS